MGYAGSEVISIWVLFIGGLALFIYFIISLVFWRCPKCKKRLPMRFDSKNNIDEVLCPYCNANFLYYDYDKK